MSLPQLRSGRVVRAWRLGPAVCALVGDCRNVQAAEFTHVLFAAVPPESKVRMAVVAEVNPLAAFGASSALRELASQSGAKLDLGIGGSGSHHLGVFDHRGHRNLESSDRWEDAQAFAKRALEIAGESLGVSGAPEEIDPSPLELALGSYSEPPSLALRESVPLASVAPPATAAPTAAAAPPAAEADNPERLFASVASLLALDGELAPAERSHLGVLGRSLGLSGSAADRVLQQVLHGKKSIVLPGAPEGRWRLFEELVTAAAADGIVHPTEIKALGAIASKLSLPPHELHRRLTEALAKAESARRR
ncbi:MAG: TerB family tellurite resistance protein [Planctomycetia bacterium]|nr:TerB family tellurite resistance protein [Planctomycetia bacterium]